MQPITIVRLESEVPRALKVVGVPIGFLRTFSRDPLRSGVMRTKTWSYEEEHSRKIRSADMPKERYAVACIDPVDNVVKVLEGGRSIFSALRRFWSLEMPVGKQGLVCTFTQTGRGINTRHLVTPQGIHQFSDHDWQQYEAAKPNLYLLIDSHRQAFIDKNPGHPVIFQREDNESFHFNHEFHAEFSGTAPVAAMKSVSTICPDCQGSGRYISLLKNEPCSRCHGAKFI